MKILFFLLFLIILIPSVLGVGFSPSSLTFNLKPNEEDCGKITLNSDSEKITVLDKWAENENTEWKVSLFNTSASDHGLSVNYPEELLIDEREVNVCLSGSNLGEYHGVIIFKQEQEGNSIVQLAVWLKVIIEEKQEEEQKESYGGSSSSGGDSSSKSSKISEKDSNLENSINDDSNILDNTEELKVEIKREIIEKKEANEQIVDNVQEIEKNLKEDTNKINNIVPLGIGIIVLIILVFLILFIVLRRRKHAL